MGSAPKYKTLQRAPRYVLRPGDSEVVRFMVKGRGSEQSFKTAMSDISSSGMAFTIASFKAPRIGDSVALEFKVPNARQIACYGKVVRIEEVKSTSSMHMVKVGIAFEQMLPSYRKLLEEQLALRTREIASEASRTKRRNFITKWSKHSIHSTVSVVKITIVLFALYIGVKVIWHLATRPFPVPEWAKIFTNFAHRADKSKPVK